MVKEMSMYDSIGTPIFDVNRNSDPSRNDNIGMSIGTRIREARKLREMTQKELAAKIGIKQSTLSELETGESAGTTYLARIAAVLRVNALWLEAGKGPRDSQSAADASQAGGTGFFDLRAETAEELRLLGIYRMASEREREAIDDAVRHVQQLIQARGRDASAS